MKKFLIVTALVGMVAAPAFAGLAPERPQNEELVPYAIGAGPRSVPYVENDAGHMYDNMGGFLAPPPAPAGTVVGPADILYQWTQGVASGAVCNLIQLKPGASVISSAHVAVDNRLAGTPRTMSIAFRNNSGGAIGSFLFDTGTLTAWYAFPGMPVGAVNLMTFTFPDVLVTQEDVWMCFQATYPFRLRGKNQFPGGGPNTQVDGAPGDNFANNGAFFIGSGSGRLAWQTGGGVGIGSASVLANNGYIDSPFPSPTGSRIGNFHVSLGGVPEPATAALIGLVGLLSLRRRKVKA